MTGIELAGIDGCECGSDLVTCAGCGTLRCLSCDPVRSDDCVWSV